MSLLYVRREGSQGAEAVSDRNPFPVEVENVVTTHESHDLVCVGDEQITVAATAIGLTQTTLAALKPDLARGSLEQAQVRFRGAGKVPTSSVGEILEIGTPFEIDNLQDMERTSFIRTGGTSGILNIHYYKRLGGPSGGGKPGGAF